MQSFILFNEASAKTTLQYHKVLNQKLWIGTALDRDVRTKLIQIARAWQKSANIPTERVHDIVLTGGNANYNYTRQSDLDVHLMVDYAKFGKDRVFVTDYFMAKKALWSVNHPHVRVRGYAVEVFAEDIKAPQRVGHGVYSLLKGRWIHQPELIKINFKKDLLLQHKVATYTKQIDELVKGGNVAAAVELNQHIRMMRGAAIQHGGEFSFENLVFKDLRNKGYLDRLSNFIQTYKEKQLSLA